MEGDLQRSPQFSYPIDGGDIKYVSGLSTILVATIQEAKDRISQIEYIFCSQLFPTFQSKSKSLQKIYSEARKAADDSWKEKENDLLLQIEKLQLENKLILEENQSLKLEKTKFVNRENPMSNKIYELQEELKQKAQEVAEAKEMQLNLLRDLETKASVISNNEEILKECRERNKLLYERQKSSDLKASKFEKEFRMKSLEFEQLMELLNKMARSKEAMIMDKEKQLREQEGKTNEQKIYSEARKAADDSWKEKENDLLLQIEKLQLENKLILEENQSLKLEKTKFVNREDPMSNKIYELQEELKQKAQVVAEAKEMQLNLLRDLETKASVISNNEEILKECRERNKLLYERQKSSDLKASKFEKEFRMKSLEFEQLMELLNKMARSKEAMIMDKEKQLREQEGKTNELLAKIESLKKNIDEIQGQLSAKIYEVEKEKDLRQKLLKETELHLQNIVNNGQLLDNYETEKKLLTGKVQSLEESVDGLQKELRSKIEELEGGRKLQERLLQQIDMNRSEMLKTGQQLQELEKEKKLLLAKLKGLEEKVDKLHMDLRERSNETSEGMELHGKLLQQIEAKDSELLSEKKRKRELILAYKSLKSQHNFLRAKFGLTPESMLPQNKIEDESDSSRDNQNPLTSPDSGKTAPNALKDSCEINEEKENLEDNKGEGLIQPSSSDLPSTSNSPVAPNCPSDVKSGLLSGTKRRVSSWRDTRSHQRRGGLDPHDDFLDTPLENIKENIKKATKEEVHDPPDSDPKDTDFDSSDAEMQDVNRDPDPENLQLPVPRPGTKGFKYVEPVRKKAERQNLKGIECNQCKKFYDAVLPDGGVENTDGKKQQSRCEHQDGVSRHRYRYAPPLTPEGFWNIGFESEM